MRFHKISPCPKCGGKVKAKWEEQPRHAELIFRCLHCGLKVLIACTAKPRLIWEWDRGKQLAAAICRWNEMRNGDKRYRLICESLGGRR